MGPKAKILISVVLIFIVGPGRLAANQPSKHTSRRDKVYRAGTLLKRRLLDTARKNLPWPTVRRLLHSQHHLPPNSPLHDLFRRNQQAERDHHRPIHQELHSPRNRPHHPGQLRRQVHRIRHDGNSTRRSPGHKPLLLRNLCKPRTPIHSQLRRVQSTSHRQCDRPFGDKVVQHNPERHLTPP